MNLQKLNKEAEPAQERQPFFIMILGTNGTGKTTKLKELILNELKKEKNHILILTPDDAEFTQIPEVHPDFPDRIQRYSGTRKIIVTRSQAGAVLESVRKNFKKGTLIFDDCRAYFDPSTLSILETIFVRRRQMQIDILAVAHGPSKVPPAFFSYLTHIILFKTNDPMKIRADRFDDISRWEAIQAEVNRKAADNPYYFEIHKI